MKLAELIRLLEMIASANEAEDWWVELPDGVVVDSVTIDEDNQVVVIR